MLDDAWKCFACQGETRRVFLPTSSNRTQDVPGRDPVRRTLPQRELISPYKPRLTLPTRQPPDDLLAGTSLLLVGGRSPSRSDAVGVLERSREHNDSSADLGTSWGQLATKTCSGDGVSLKLGCVKALSSCHEHSVDSWVH